MFPNIPVNTYMKTINDIMSYAKASQKEVQFGRCINAKYPLWCSSLADAKVDHLTNLISTLGRTTINDDTSTFEKGVCHFH